MRVDLRFTGTVNDRPLDVRGEGECDRSAGELTVRYHAPGGWPGDGFDPRVIIDYAGDPSRLFAARVVISGVGDPLRLFVARENEDGVSGLGNELRVDYAREVLARDDGADAGSLTVTGYVRSAGDVVICRQRVRGELRLASPVAKVVTPATGWLLPDAADPRRVTTVTRLGVVLEDGRELEVRTHAPYVAAADVRLDRPLAYVIEREDAERVDNRTYVRRCRSFLTADVPVPA